MLVKAMPWCFAPVESKHDACWNSATFFSLLKRVYHISAGLSIGFAWNFQFCLEKFNFVLLLESMCGIIIVGYYMITEVGPLARSYNKLWKLMIDKKINKTQLCKAAGITTNAMAKLGRDESVPLETLEKICETLDCNIEDVVEITSEQSE